MASRRESKMKNRISFMVKSLRDRDQVHLNLMLVEFVGGAADGLRESWFVEDRLDGLVGFRRDSCPDGTANIALYGLSHEANGIRYRFLRYLA